jgi:hypothetical protein
MSEHAWDHQYASHHSSVPPHPPPTCSSAAYYGMDMPAIHHDLHSSLVLSSENGSYPKWPESSYPPSTSVTPPYPPAWTTATAAAVAAAGGPDQQPALNYLMHPELSPEFAAQQSHHPHHQHPHHHPGSVSWDSPDAKGADPDMRQHESFLFHPGAPAVSQSPHLGFDEPLAADNLEYHPGALPTDHHLATSSHGMPRKESSDTSYSSSYHRDSLAPPPQHLLSGGTSAGEDSSWYPPYRNVRAHSHSPYPPSGVPYAASSLRSSPTGHQDRRRPSSMRSARPRVHSAPLMDEETAASLLAAAERKRLQTSSPEGSGSPEEQLFVHEHFPSPKSGSVASAAQRKQIQKLSHWRRAGGRTVGSHLAPDKAARTKEMREKGSCWLCALQRDQVCSTRDLHAAVIMLTSASVLLENHAIAVRSESTHLVPIPA